MIFSLISTTPAYADVTAQEVWDNWKSSLGLYGDGAVVTGDESLSGGTLTVSDLSITFSDEVSTVTSEIGEIVFTEQGDGTVRVTMPTTTPITLTTTPEFGDPVTVNIVSTQSGADMVVSGTPEEMSFDLSADSYTVALDSIDGDTDDAIVNAATLTISGVEAGYTSSVTDLNNLSYSMSAEELSVILDVSEDGGPGTFKLLGSISGLESDAEFVLPLEIDPDNPESLFVDGLSIDVVHSFGAADYAFSFAGDGETAEGTATSAGGSFEVAFDQDGFDMSAGSVGPAMAFQGSAVPFPVQISLAEISYGMNLPLSATDTPEPFGAQVLISDLSVNEELWSLIDPGALLDHGPATLNINITGAAKLLYDVLDPAQMAAIASADMPGELYELNLEDLTLRIAGAELNGEGSFTFDNTDLETFGGMPRPTGSVELQASGINGLIDTLVQMGLVPEQQVMGARMMIGMFAQTVGDDQLESTLEINEEGHVIANGQRIQ